jgi:hypothetical protein
MAKRTIALELDEAELECIQAAVAASQVDHMIAISRFMREHGEKPLRPESGDLLARHVAWICLLWERMTAKTRRKALKAWKREQGSGDSTPTGEGH